MVNPSNQAGVRPFDFAKLPKISREEAGLVNALYRYLPVSLSAETLQRAVESLIAAELGEDCSLKPVRVHTVEAGPYLQTLPQPGIYAVLGMPPLEVKAFCEIDFLLGHVVIDRLLGGEGRPPRTIGPLTEIEQGVFSYLWLKLLAEFYRLAGEIERVHFRMQELCSTPDELDRFLRSGDRLVVLSFEAKLGKRSGYFRLLFPESFVEKVFLEPLGPIESEAGYEPRLEAFAFVPTHVWIDAGRVTIRHQELVTLQPGDAVVLDKSEIRLKPEGMEGHVAVRIGNGEKGAFRGELVAAEKGRVRIRLEEAYWGHPV